MRYSPLLNIKDALADADRNLRDVLCDLETLQRDSEGHYPPGVMVALECIATIQSMLKSVIPQELKEAISREQAEYERALQEDYTEEHRW